MEKATIYDYARMCGSPNPKCDKCKLHALCRVGYNCTWVLRNQTDEANEIILNWCKEHPIKTRQSEFLKMFPNADIYKGAINICPCKIDCDYDCKNKEKYADFDCTGCKKAYWLAEVDE